LAASALDPFQRIELRFQKLTDFGLARVKQPPKVFGLLQVSTQCGNTHEFHPPYLWAQHKPQRQPSPHKSIIAPPAPVSRNTFAANRAGAQRNRRSGVRNVSRREQRWCVRVKHNGRTIYVGTFDSLGEADAAAHAKRNVLFTANFSDRAVSALTQG
jgi:hypothetical protein